MKVCQNLSYGEKGKADFMASTVKEKIAIMKNSLDSARERMEEEFKRVGNSWVNRATTILTHLGYLEFPDVEKEIGAGDMAVIRSLNRQCLELLSTIRSSNRDPSPEETETFHERVKMIAGVLANHI